MLVNQTRATHDDQGSVLLAVVVVMMVLTVVAVAVTGLVLSTAAVAAGGKSTAQSRAAADAGLAEAVAQARRTGEFCPLSPAVTSATYDVSASCSSGAVTFTSTGMGTTKTQAIYAYTSTPATGGADFYAYSSATFTSDVITKAPPERLLNLVVRDGSFTCQAPVPANITVNGDFNSHGNCIVSGKVWAGGVSTLCCVADHFLGDFITAGAGSAQIRGSVDGQVWTAGPVSSARRERSRR